MGIIREKWKSVVGYEDLFLISNFGRLYSKRTSRVLSQTLLKNGYLTHSTKIGGRSGKCICFRIHILVAEAFLPNPDLYQIEWARTTKYGKVHVNHKDGNKINNNYYNLEWATAHENIQHAVCNGLIKKQTGEDVKCAKLTNIQAKEIRELYSSGGFTQQTLADMYGVKRGVIYAVTSGKTYLDNLVL